MQEKTTVSLSGIDTSNVSGGEIKALPLDDMQPAEDLEKQEEPSEFSVSVKDIEKDYEVD